MDCDRHSPTDFRLEPYGFVGHNGACADYEVSLRVLMGKSLSFLELYSATMLFYGLKLYVQARSVFLFALWSVYIL